jgi:hypothetical protein
MLDIFLTIGIFVTILILTSIFYLLFIFAIENSGNDNGSMKKLDSTLALIACIVILSLFLSLLIRDRIIDDISKDNNDTITISENSISENLIDK